jgi:hypothetical protein
MLLSRVPRYIPMILLYLSFCFLSYMRGVHSIAALSYAGLVSLPPVLLVFIGGLQDYIYMELAMWIYFSFIRRMMPFFEYSVRRREIAALLRWFVILKNIAFALITLSYAAEPLLVNMFESVVMFAVGLVFYGLYFALIRKTYFSHYAQARSVYVFGGVYLLLCLLVTVLNLVLSVSGCGI